MPATSLESIGETGSQEACAYPSVSAPTDLHLQARAEASHCLLRSSSGIQQQVKSSDWLQSLTVPALSAMKPEDVAAAANSQPEQARLQGSNDASTTTTGHDYPDTSQQASSSSATQDESDVPVSLAHLSLNHVRSTSPSISHQRPSGRTAGSQSSPPHHSRLSAASPSSQGSSRMQASPRHEARTVAGAQSPARQQQHATGPSSASISGTQHQSAAQPTRHVSGQSRQQIHQRAGSEWYPPYGQPPPPPPASQHQRPSMQWHTGQPRHQYANGTARMSSQHAHQQPGHQQHMGMPPAGLGTYPNVVPYPMLPGMQPQGNMLLHNGYMGMLAYYPAVPQGNLPFYPAETGQRGGPRSYGHAAPFPPALDPQYVQYMQQLAQHQGYTSSPGLATQQRTRTASTSGQSSSFSSASKLQGHARGNAPTTNGFHRRSSSAMSAASSAASADRDTRNRPMHDRRGDSATATNSSRGSRGQHLDEATSSADAEHMAEAASLLEQLKGKNRTQPFELKDIKGYMYEFCRDQHGSRFIQQKLAEGPPEQLMEVYQEIQPHVIGLMQDVFGNYVIQKCFEHGNQEVLEALTDTITGHVLALTLQMYGCRVIQKALEVLPLEQQRVIAKEIQGHVMRCVKDQNGNHVIQKSIERIKPTTEIVPIIEDVQSNVGQLATHPYGCRVVQRVLEHCTIADVKDRIRGEILRTTLPLATDQYGNYVIQHMLEHGPESARAEIVANLLGQIVQLSQHKFASNVVEKCLQYGQPEGRQAVIQEVLGSSEEVQGEAGPLQMMMKDQYANYVVQKMLEVCDDSQRQVLMARITTHLNQLKKLTYGKHIVARVEKLLVAGSAAATQQESQEAADSQQQSQTAELLTGNSEIGDTDNQTSEPTDEPTA